MGRNVRAILKELHSPGSNVLELLDAHRGHGFDELWTRDPRLFRAFGQRLISADHSAAAFELIREGLHDHPDDHDLLYFRALALARGGNTSKTAELVDQLLRRPGLELWLKVEAISLLGRIEKDRYERSNNPKRKLRFATKSAALYEKAHRLTGDSFPGINAATMSLLARRKTNAHRLAARVINQAQAERRKRGRANDYWLFATLGEANLILGHMVDAANWYRKAVRGAARRIGDIVAMRRNVQLLATTLEAGDEIRSLFEIGRVIVFSGHMIDHPDRVGKDGLPPRFPPDSVLERKVSRAIKAKLEELNAFVGFSSAACGSDILFAEQMLKRGAELHIVLPFDTADFCRTSVDYGLKGFSSWRKRFDAVLNRATAVHHATTEPFLDDDILFEFVNTVTQGLAITRAARLGIEPYALAVLDPSSEKRVGGTGYFVNAWTEGGRKDDAINLRTIRSEASVKTSSRVRAAKSIRSKARTRGLRRELKSMLFADLKNFSQLREEQSPAFFEGFLGAIVRVIDSSEPGPVFQNTWGDGVYLVFDRVTECADLALRMLDRIGRLNFEKIGLPEDTAVRIGLHAGPVFPGEDPIINCTNFFGSHVTRAARIEPVTPPGCAFTSEQFAAALAAEPGHDFVCEFVGTEELAKGYDKCPLYRLVRGH